MIQTVKGAIPRFLREKVVFGSDHGVHVTINALNEGGFVLRG